jgi:DNA-directed RNA polymerase specialized sigma24 family protein
LSLACAKAPDDEAVYDLISELHALYGTGKVRLEPLLSELRLSVRRIVDRRKRAAKRVSSDEVQDEIADSDPESDPADGAMVLLADALRAKVIDEREHALVVLTVIQEISLRDLAEQLCVPYRTLQSQHLRAKKKLAGYLRRGGYS